MMENDKAFEFFDFSIEEAVEVAKEIATEGGDRDGRICLCGHPMTRHQTYGGVSTCTPTRLVCLCKHMRPVVDVSDTRYFLRKTRGAGPLHALSQGVLAAMDVGVSVKWLVDTYCDKCEEVKQVSPVPVSQRGVVMDEATGFDALLCMECRSSGSGSETE